MSTGHSSDGAWRARDYYAGTHRRVSKPGAHRRRARNQGSEPVADGSRGTPSRGNLAGVLAATLLVGGAVAVPYLPISGSNTNTNTDAAGGGLTPLPGPAASLGPSSAATGEDPGSTAAGAETSRPSDDAPAAGRLFPSVDPSGNGRASIDDCPHVVVDEPSLTVRAVDRNDEVPGYDTLSVTGRLNGDPADLTAFVALWDPNGLPVTMARTVLPFGSTDSSASPAEWTLARLDGAAIGDAGASGVFTVKVVLLPDAQGCPFSPLVRTVTPQLAASDFVGWPVTVQRLRERLESYLAAGAVTGPVVDELRAALPSGAAESGVRTFLSLVDVATGQGYLSPEASSRLRSLAERLSGPEDVAVASPLAGAGPVTGTDL